MAGTNEHQAVKGETQKDIVDTPWSTTTVFNDVAADSFAAVSVTSDPTDTATCRIFVDDKEVSELTKQGVAECIVGLADATG